MKFHLRYCVIHCLMASIALCGCFGENLGGIDTVNEIRNGFYYIDNGTEYTLSVEAMTPGDVTFPWPLLHNEIPADTIVNFFILEPNVFTDLTPGCIFGDFKVTANMGGKDSLIYQAVLNSDWELRDVTGGPHYYLAFPR